MYEKYFKRILDFVMAFLGLIILSPVMLLIAILVRIKLGSPIIFAQPRPGLNEKIFTLYKFRTMTDERDEKGELLPDEQRLTPFGKFLRSTSLDELPELWNILKGEMSFVGPRPLLVRYLPYYTDEERLRHCVRPGLTGLSQISGRNYLVWDKRLKLDVQYVKDISFVNDIDILFTTLKKVICREDIAIGCEHDFQSLDMDRGNMVSNGVQYK